MLILLLLVLLGSAGVLSWYLLYKIKYRFWELKNVPYLEPIFPLGHLHNLFTTRHYAYVFQSLYQQLKPLGDFAGLYWISSPMMFVLTPEFAKNVLVRDFAYFTNRGLYHNTHADPLSANLFFLDGSEWRRLRQKFSTTFTSGKIKEMYHTMVAVSEEVVKQVNLLIDQQRPLVDIKDLSARFTTDIIGSCGFGIECNSVINPNAEFREMGKKMFTSTVFGNFKITFCMLYKKPASFLKAKFSKSDVIKFLLQFVRNSMKYRSENNIRRTDFMQMMIDMHKNDSNDTKLTINEIAAQSFLFFFAGFETSSTTITFALYELALNEEIQEKLRSEVSENFYMNDGKFTYESINSLVYLDKVLSETLRKYPPVSTLHRAVSKDYPLPNGSILPTGTFVTIPTYAFHHDPELYPNPELFDPERFSDENKEQRHPCSYLPFGEGSRNCVGMRFGLLQTKLGVATMIRNFKFSPCHKTQIPLEIDPIGLVFVPKKDMYLRVERC